MLSTNKIQLKKSGMWLCSLQTNKTGPWFSNNILEISSKIQFSQTNIIKIQ